MSTIKELAAEARARGDVRFNTGEPCVNGHRADREATSRRCLECDRLAHATEHGRALRRAWRRSPTGKAHLRRTRATSNARARLRAASAGYRERKNNQRRRARKLARQRAAMCR